MECEGRVVNLRCQAGFLEMLHSTYIVAMDCKLPLVTTKTDHGEYSGRLATSDLWYLLPKVTIILLVLF